MSASREDMLKMLGGTGLSVADLELQQYIPAEKLAQVLRNIYATGVEPGWAARMGSQLSMTAHGPLGFAAISAPTLGAALRVMVNFLAVRTTSITAALRDSGNQTLFVVNDLSGDAQFAQWVAETSLKVIQSLIETIIGRPAEESVQVSFSSAAPDYQDSLAAIFGVPCRFDAQYTAIAIPRSWLEIRSPLYDEGVYRINIAKCREIINARQQRQDPVHQTRTMLALHFERVRREHNSAYSPPSLEAVANTLHITPRTLIRHLRSQSTSFRELLEKARERCAKELLMRANLSIADIGYRIGYSSPANFSRAFKRWTGMTPVAWRRQL